MRTVTLSVLLFGSAAAIKPIPLVLVDEQRGGRKVPIWLYYPSVTAAGAQSPPLPLVVFAHCLFGADGWYDYLADKLVETGYALPQLAHISMRQQGQMGLRLTRLLFLMSSVDRVGRFRTHHCMGDLRVGRQQREATHLVAQLHTLLPTRTQNPSVGTTRQTSPRSSHCRPAAGGTMARKKKVSVAGLPTQPP